MEKMDGFEDKIRRIFYFVGEYGIERKPIHILFQSGKVTDQDKAEYLMEVHAGFRLGQDAIVEEFLRLLKEKKILIEAENVSRRAKEQQKLQDIRNQMRAIEHQISILRHLADFIAWQFFKNQYYKARRFFSGSRSRPDLMHSNLESVLLAVKHFHSLDKRNFALITDLTSFIDVGDILLNNGESITIVECKTGETHGRVMDFLKEISEKEVDLKKIDYSNKNLDFFNQVKRTLNQLQRGNRVKNFINTEKGFDTFSGEKIVLDEMEKPNEYYFEYLRDKITESKDDDSAYGQIEDIVYFAIYRKSKLAPSWFVFKHMADKILQNYVAVDYLSMISIPLKEPIFFKPFGKETLFDLLFQRVKIYLALDLDKLIALFNSNGLESKWMSKKDTHLYKETNKGHKPFVYKNRAVEVRTALGTLVLGDSFVIYLLFDNLTPTSLINQYKYRKRETDEEA